MDHIYIQLVVNWICPTTMWQNMKWNNFFLFLSNAILIRVQHLYKKIKCYTTSMLYGMGGLAQSTGSVQYVMRFWYKVSITTTITCSRIFLFYKFSRLDFKVVYSSFVWRRKKWCKKKKKKKGQFKKKEFLIFFDLNGSINDHHKFD